MSDVENPNFERVEKGSKKLDDPRLTINDEGKGYINRTARMEWFEGVESVGMYFDPENKVLGFALDEDHEDSYTVTHAEDAGCSIVMMGALNALGIDREELDGKESVPLVEDGSLIIADLGEIAEPAKE